MARTDIEKAQTALNVVVEMRDQALARFVQLAIKKEDADAEIEELKAEIAELKKKPAKK